MKRILVICILITVLAFLITAALIVNNRIKAKEYSANNLPINEDIRENNHDINTVKLTDNSKYTFENLGFEEYYDNGLNCSKKQIKETFDGREYHIEYVEISGLNNQTIETSINQEIKEKCINLKDEFLSYVEKEIDGKKIKELFSPDKIVETKCDVEANFSNVLSIHMYTEIYYSPIHFAIEDTLNYDLNTGNHLTIDDIFVNTNKARTYVVKGINDCMNIYYLDWYESEEARKSEQVDNNILKVVKAYDSGYYKFYFS